jgi:branched-chain amino acid aminotransferase
VFWYDGALHESSVARFDLTDRGLTLGDGIFDTSLARNGRIFQRKAHLKRFAANAEAIGIDLDQAAAVKALDSLAKVIGNGAVRLTLTRGGGARGLRLPEHPKPFLFGSAAPDRPEMVFASVHLATTPIRRNETSPSSRLKTLSYLDAILAGRDVWAKGADEAVFENTRGHLACTSTGNVFAVFGRRLVTPPLSDGVLAGIMRAWILAHAGASECEAVEQSLAFAELLEADAVFVTNSLRLVAPCRALDDTVFRSLDHPLIKKLQTALRSAILAECGVF